MRELILMRHAKSSWADPDRSDRDRPLNPRGVRTAPRMGAWLAEEGLLPDYIVCSTARRAVQSVDLVVEAMDHTTTIAYRDDMYMATPWVMTQEVARVPKNVQRLLLVGHNPGMEELLEELTGDRARMPTAAIARLEVPLESWKDLDGVNNLKLLQLVTPKDLPNAQTTASA